MRTSIRRSLPTAAALATTAALSLGAFTSTANAHTQPAASTAQHQYCATVLAPLQANQTYSRVLSEKCSPQHAAGSNLPAGFTAPKDRTPIWTGYSGRYYTGYQWTWFGKARPCDNRGYLYNNARKLPIRSWRAQHGCWHTTIYTGFNRSGKAFPYHQGVWEAGQIGKPWNNHVWSIWTRRR